MSEIKINKVYLMDMLVESGASEEVTKLLKGVKTITFKDTNTTIILVEKASIDSLDKGVV